MNKLDTALVTAALTQAGFALTNSHETAGIVIINTCSVRAHAEDKVFSHLGHLKHIKQSRPHLTVAVIGCMAQRLGPDLLTHPAVDIVCGPAQIHQIPKLLSQTANQKKTHLAVTQNIRKKQPAAHQNALDDFEARYSLPDNSLPSQAYVRAMRGCNNFCTYCIVPYVRGPEISRPPAAILQQVRKLAHSGIKQITLLGQTVNSYEYSAGGKTYCLADLLEAVSKIDGIEWIKFITSYPHKKFFTQIIQAIADLPKLCPYLHMPAQSGSDKILKAMNRNYTAAKYLELLDLARQAVPDIAIAGDFIVGFPGETDDDFLATVELVRKARYKNCFVFRYSPRPHTTADRKLPDNISAALKQQRNTQLLAVQEKISGELTKQFLNRTVTVLVEGLSKKPHLNTASPQNNPQLVARTAGDYIVVFNGPKTLTGKFAKVKITKTRPLTLFGQLA